MYLCVAGFYRGSPSPRTTCPGEKRGVTEFLAKVASYSADQAETSNRSPGLLMYLRGCCEAIPFISDDRSEVGQLDCTLARV